MGHLRMNFESYLQLFSDIFEAPHPLPPYDDEHYINYTKLNWARQQRWLKTGVLNMELVDLIKGINKKQFWTIITEPWCGDAAHSLPFVHRLLEYNGLIEADYQLRDSPPFLIEHYLTNGVSKSIPKLIIRDENNKDLATWGPRPAGCQLLYDQLLAAHVSMEEKKIEMQKWYNNDKGESVQKELLAVLSKVVEG